MADAFHVFVEGPELETPGALKKLADAIAKHYGLGAADLLARLEKGRFRVKTNTDRETAETYARDLGRLGAVCTIEEATPANSQRTTPIPFPAVRPDTPPAGNPVVKPTLPPPNRPQPGAATASVPPKPSTPPPITGLAAAGPRASTPPPMGGAGTPSSPPPMGNQVSSGLSAAFSGEMPAADLGALGADSFSLASLDGVDDNSGGGGSIGPATGGGIPASIGPAVEKPKPKTDKVEKAAKGAKPKDEPLDMFAPPEMQGEEFKVDIAADEAEFSARKRASTPPPMETVSEGAEPAARASSQKIPTPAQRKSQPSLQVPNQPVTMATSVPSKLGPLADERVRFAAGVVLAVLLGFVPAHFVAKMKEESADEKIDRKVIAAQQAVETPEMYANLERLRADQLDRKESEHRNAAIMGFAVWALIGGGIAFAWFKKVPWDSMG